MRIGTPLHHQHLSRQGMRLRVLLGALTCGSCAMVGSDCHAQDAVSGFVPSFGVSTTYRDARGQLTLEQDRQFVTQFLPGFSWTRKSGRIQGSVNYLLDARVYSDQSEANENLNTLSAVLTAEALENWVFVDAQASIAQEAISPYGQPVSNSSLIANDNRTEVRRFALSPYMRGSLPGLARYEVRWSSVRSDGGRAVASDADTDTALVTLNSPIGGTIFSWGAKALRQQTSFGSGSESESDRLNIGLSAAVDVDLLLGVNGGRESTNVVGAARRSYDNWGWNLRWTPSPRTDLAIGRDKRYFGHSHQLSFSHRLRRSTWVYSDIRDLSLGTDTSGVGQPLTIYSLYYSLFASQQPDPVQRDLMVREFLKAIGQDPNAYISGGVLNTAVTLQRRQDLAVAIQWPRTSLNLQAFSSHTRQLQDTDRALALEPLDQHGYTASVFYRLTPQSSLALSGMWQRTGANRLQSAVDLTSGALTWSSQLGPHVGTSLSLRYTKSESAVNPYRESAATASLNLRF